MTNPDTDLDDKAKLIMDILWRHILTYLPNRSEDIRANLFLGIRKAMNEFITPDSYKAVAESKIKDLELMVKACELVIAAAVHREDKLKAELQAQYELASVERDI